MAEVLHSSHSLSYSGNACCSATSSKPPRYAAEPTAVCTVDISQATFSTREKFGIRRRASSACESVLTFPKLNHSSSTLALLQESHEHLFSRRALRSSTHLASRCSSMLLGGNLRARMSSTFNGLDVYIRGSMMFGQQGKIRRERYSSCFRGLSEDFHFDPRTSFAIWWANKEAAEAQADEPEDEVVDSDSDYSETVAPASPVLPMEDIAVSAFQTPKKTIRPYASDENDMSPTGNLAFPTPSSFEQLPPPSPRLLNFSPRSIRNTLKRRKRRSQVDAYGRKITRDPGVSVVSEDVFGSGEAYDVFGREGRSRYYSETFNSFMQCDDPSPGDTTSNFLSMTPSPPPSSAGSWSSCGSSSGCSSTSCYTPPMTPRSSLASVVSSSTVRPRTPQRSSSAPLPTRSPARRKLRDLIVPPVRDIFVLPNFVTRGLKDHSKGTDDRWIIVNTDKS
ncbi:hypothetical protein FISHEDRAFT_58261 [Fistulina hepatica ATCC 64428]|nr:hypothetical protein FISHEDRAFT_58261 [Fistulina hepatica ATCC 64428]